MGSRRCQCIVAFEGGSDRREAGYTDKKSLNSVDITHVPINDS